MSFPCRAGEAGKMLPCKGPACPRCGGTRHLDKILFLGRYRTRVEIARWFLAQREWKGAKVKTANGNVYLSKGASLMRLEGFTPEELTALGLEHGLVIDTDATRRIA